MMNDPNFKLLEYLKYDTSLGREQNIDLGKDSSLACADIIKLKGGVILTQFASDKRTDKITNKEEVSLSS
jgi:hypothetical protein